MLEFPPAFVSRMQAQLRDEAASFFEALKKPSPVSVRVNRKKSRNVPGQPVPWCDTGFYLDVRPVFTLDPLFHAGSYYVQEASSMFMEQVFKNLDLDKRDLLILDACAAPGGKSTHIASLMSMGSLLVSNETIGSRIPVLNENMVKWGSPGVVITNNDPSSFTLLENMFDVIVVDAPCSGEGLFRKDADAAEEWSSENCSLCSSRQQRILTSLIPALKPEGILVYCTCTYNPDENGNIIKWALKTFDMESVQMKVQNDWGIREDKEGEAFQYSFFPHRVKGEGFFLSVLKKSSLNLSQGKRKNRQGQFAALPAKFKKLEEWISDPENYELLLREERVTAIPKRWKEQMEIFLDKLRVVHSGTLVAELKGDKAVPDHELAMSELLKGNYFPVVELNREEALKYLRKEDFQLPAAEKGFALVCFEGHPLGFINRLDRRFNNNYPSAWRIRMK